MRNYCVNFRYQAGWVNDITLYKVNSYLVVDVDMSVFDQEKLQRGLCKISWMTFVTICLACCFSLIHLFCLGLYGLGCKVDALLTEGRINVFLVHRRLCRQQLCVVCKPSPTKTLFIILYQLFWQCVPCISPFIRAHRSVGVLSQYIINTRTHPGLRAMQPVYSICITCIKELCRYIWVWRIITTNELNLKLYKGVYNLLNPIS